MNSKGIDKLMFEFEAPVIIFPNKNNDVYTHIPDWLLARIKYERLFRDSDEEIATPSEGVAYLMTVLQNDSIDDGLHDLYIKYYNSITECSTDEDIGNEIDLTPKEEELFYNLRHWIYEEQLDYFANKYIKTYDLLSND